MEGPVQIKNSTSTTTTTATTEPIKSEEVVQGSDSSERSDGAASPPPNCSICLGKLVNTSFTDSCLHQFCFTCLLQWSKIKTECPLCKQTFKSIIHNVRSEEDYDQYHVPRELASQLPQPQVMAALDVNFEVDRHWDLHRFFYRTTMTDGRRRRALQHPEQVQRRDQLPSNVPQPSREEHRIRRPNSADYRRAVYRHGIWATTLPDVYGRFHDCSADYYRRHPRELERLIPWLNRELQVLINNMPAYIPYVLRTIMDALTQHDIRSPQFRNIVRQYCGVHTEHFIHELLNFARSNFDLAGYDQAVTYLFQGLSREYMSHVVSPVPSSSSISSDDSDVRVVEEAIDLRMNTELPSVGPHPMNMPGPSTVGQAFRMEASYNVPDVLTISSASSDDECEVIGYVKPRHERTPEIIELISSDPEDINISHAINDNAESSRISYSRDEPQPGTSQISKKGSVKKIPSETLRIKLSEVLSSESDDSDLDSDYNPRRSKQRKSHVKKRSKRSVSGKRHKSSNTRNRKRVERSASSSDESIIRKKNNRSSRITKTKVCSSSDSNFDAERKRKVSETKPKKEQDLSMETTRTYKDCIKKEDRYMQDDNAFTSSSSSSSSDSETSNEDRTYKARTQERSKRKYFNSSRNYEIEKNERTTRNKEKVLVDDCIKKDNKLKDSKQSRFRSSSESSYAPQRNRRSSCSRRQLQKNKNDYEIQDESNLRSITSWRRERSSKARSDESDSQFRDTSRSSSHSSDYSNRSYSHWRRSKRRSILKDKKRKRLSSTSSNSDESVYSAPNSTPSSSPKSDVYSASKRSDSKSSSSSKERRRSHRNHKKSKYKKSQSKLKAKRKKRYIRSSSSSISE